MQKIYVPWTKFEEWASLELESVQEDKLIHRSKEAHTNIHLVPKSLTFWTRGTISHLVWKWTGQSTNKKYQANFTVNYNDLRTHLVAIYPKHKCLYRWDSSMFYNRYKYCWRNESLTCNIKRIKGWNVSIPFGIHLSRQKS